MSQQLKIEFSKNTIRNINVYTEAAKTESRTDGSQVKLTATQKEALKSICKEQNISISSFIADALETYIQIFPYKNKIQKHKDLLLNILNNFTY